MLYVIPTDAKIGKSVTKKMFPCVIIMCGTCYNGVSYYYVINVVMVNVKTMTVEHFKHFKSFRRN